MCLQELLPSLLMECQTLQQAHDETDAIGAG